MVLSAGLQSVPTCVQRTTQPTPWWPSSAHACKLEIAAIRDLDASCAHVTAAQELACAWYSVPAGACAHARMSLHSYWRLAAAQAHSRYTPVTSYRLKDNFVWPEKTSASRVTAS